jgi:hypothetical protein
MSNQIGSNVVLVNSDIVLQMEATIRDLAGGVINHIHVRNSHPSYGVSKTLIRSDLARMEGAIGLYMVMVGQSTHAGVTLLVKFMEKSTDDRVEQARKLVATL